MPLSPEQVENLRLHYPDHYLWHLARESVSQYGPFSLEGKSLLDADWVKIFRSLTEDFRFRAYKDDTFHYYSVSTFRLDKELNIFTVSLHNTVESEDAFLEMELGDLSKATVTVGEISTNTGDLYEIQFRAADSEVKGAFYFEKSVREEFHRPTLEAAPAETLPVR